MPNPIPNELLLIFSGYLSFKGLLSVPLIILTAVFADFIGTNILYFIFLNAGTYIISRKPKWLPFSEKLINKLTVRISEGGHLSIYIFRLTPFTRGYASVITGLLQVKPREFLPIAFISATTWASMYVIIGHLIGPSWNVFSNNIEYFKYILLGVFAVVLSLIILRSLYWRKEEKNGSAT